MCRTGEFNLLYDSLTSFAARDKLRNFKTTNPDLWAELTKTFLEFQDDADTQYAEDFIDGLSIIPSWNSYERAVGPPMTRMLSMKHLNSEARKEESLWTLIQLMSWKNVAETISFVSVLVVFLQTRSIRISLEWTVRNQDMESLLL